MPFLDEIAARLVGLGIGTRDVDLFVTRAAIIPAGNGPLILIVETGGVAPSRVQNQASALTQRPSAQISVRASSYPAARAKAKQVYDALDGVFNTTLSGTFYQRIVARQDITDIGLDGASRPMVAFNIDAEKQPS